MVAALAQLPLASRFLALNPLQLFKKPELDFPTIIMPVKIDDLLVTAIAHFASDLHLKVGSFPVMRIGGELHPIVEAPKLSPEDTLDMAFSMMSNRQKQKLKEVSEVDIAYSVKGLGRFRANIFQQRDRKSVV